MSIEGVSQKWMKPMTQPPITALHPPSLLRQQKFSMPAKMTSKNLLIEKSTCDREVTTTGPKVKASKMIMRILKFKTGILPVCIQNIQAEVEFRIGPRPRGHIWNEQWPTPLPTSLNAQPPPVPSPVKVGKGPTRNSTTPILINTAHMKHLCNSVKVKLRKNVKVSCICSTKQNIVIAPVVSQDKL